MALESLKRRITNIEAEKVVKELMEKIETLVAEQRKTNELLARIVELLEGGRVERKKA